MLQPEGKDQKHLRILIYYRELSRHKIEYDECLKFMSYQFTVSVPWLIKIIKTYSENDLAEVKLEHIDLDMIMIDAFANKLFREARKERKNATQHTLFN